MLSGRCTGKHLFSAIIVFNRKGGIRHDTHQNDPGGGSLLPGKRSRDLPHRGRYSHFTAHRSRPKRQGGEEKYLITLEALERYLTGETEPIKAEHPSGATKTWRIK